MASDFDSMWMVAANAMDDGVDLVTGDTILYALDGVTFLPIKGFVLDYNAEPGGVADFDEPLGNRKRVKIRASSIGGRPDFAHRLRHPRLGAGTFRPQGGEPKSEGRYCLFDVQKV